MRSVSGFVDGVLVEIYDRAIKDEAASENSEVPVFRTATYIKKRVPNSRDEYNQPIKSTDRDKYRDLVKAFEEGEQVELDGTPLEEWPQVSVSDIEMLKAANIYTVQAAAGMPETGLHRLPQGLRNIHTKARKWLEKHTETEELKKLNAELLKRIEKLEANQKKKPGRPRKTKAA